MAKPRRLALCVLSGRALPRRDCDAERHLAVEVAQKFGQPDRLHRRQIGIETAAGERRRLIERFCFDHLYKTGVAGGIEPFSRRREQDRGEPVRR
jgi:hypothetical protein